MKRLYIIAVLFLFAVAVQAFADPQSQFEEGLVQYRSDNWELAVTVWESLLDQGYDSGPLQYNLGNAYFRLNDLPKSILAYERAERLLPRDSDVKSNLEYVRLSVVDRVEPPVRLSLWNWIDRIRDSLTLRESATIYFLGLMMAALIALRWFIAARLWARLRPVLLGIAAFFVVCIFWYGWRSSIDAREFAIIMADKVNVYSGPDDSSTQLFALHEGTRVEAREGLTEWMRIRLADGREGWLRLKEIEII
jgi:tetratricopeptide (TPR) repeat protein